MKRIGIRELRQRASDYVRLAAAAEAEGLRVESPS